MDKWIVEVNNDDALFKTIHDEWLKNDDLYNHKEIFTQIASNLTEALQLYKERQYSLIIIYSGNREYLANLVNLNKETDVPIVVVKRERDEFMEALSNGATYVEAFNEIPETPELSIVVASKALIRLHLFQRFGEPYFPKNDNLFIP